MLAKQSGGVGRSLPPVDDARWLLSDQPYTGGNRLLLLAEGARYYEQWFHGGDELADSSEEPRYLVHSAWRFENVGRAGRVRGSPKAFEHLGSLASAGVRTRIIVSGHGYVIGAFRAATWLLAHRNPLTTMVLDCTAASTFSSNHEKLTVFRSDARVWALLGSIDMASNRFERSHERIDTRRYRSARGPSHDLGVRIDGPAAIELHDRAVVRWNFLAGRGFHRRVLRIGDTSPLSPIGTELGATLDHPSGPSLVQIVETVPDGSRIQVEASQSQLRLWVHAVDTAQRSIYLEDQYFNPDLRDTPRGAEAVPASLNPLDRLCAALERGVHITILLPSTPSHRYNPSDCLIERRRHNALARLRQVSGAHRLLHVYEYALPRNPVYVHSKLLLCDDQFLLTGSANLNRRSMLSDYEVGIGVVDAAFVESVRKTLWREHFGTHAATEHGVVHDAAVVGLTPGRRVAPVGQRAERPLTRLMTWATDQVVDPL